MSESRAPDDPGLLGNLFAPLALASAILAAAPLFPRLTPAWPRGPSGLVPLVAAGAILAVALARFASGGRPRARDLFVVGAFPLFALYAGNGLFLLSADNAATRRIASQLVTRGTLDLAQKPPFEESFGYAAVTRDRRVLPAFPIGTALLQVPYAAAALVGSGGSISPSLVARWEKHFAALLTVAAVAIFFLAARRSFGSRVAFGTSAVLALATSLFTCAAQSMWSSTGELFCTSLALLFLMSSSSARTRPAAAGVSMAAAFLCRPTALIALIVLAVVAWKGGRRDAARYGFAAAIGVSAVLFWQYRVFGNPLGAYGSMDTGDGTWGGSFPSGFVGTLLSPSRGILAWHPWLLLLPVAAIRLRPDSFRAWWRGSLAIAILTWLLASLFTKWWGGGSVGPRYFTGVAPFLALLTVPLWSSSSKRTRVALVATVAFAATTQLLAAYNPTANAWNAVVDVDSHPRILWSIRDSQLAAAWVPGWKVSASFLSTVPQVPGHEDGALTGSIDEPAGRESVHGPLSVRGWARIPGEDLRVTLFVDGVARKPSSFRRTARADVAQAVPSLGDCSSSGYEAIFPFLEGDGGEHELVAVFEASGGRMRHYPVRSFTWMQAP